MVEAHTVPMSALDILLGYPDGYSVRRIGRPPRRTYAPHEAMERVVLPALLRPPCVVAFSGGRDSSAVLAFAAALARREGLPEPLPVTRVFVGAPMSEESEWQELVIRHLGITEWIREGIDDEVDVVGPLARERLRRCGVLWSPLIHGDDFLLRHAEGGSLLDGEGGDDVCDPRPHRIRPMAMLLRQRSRPTRSRLRAAVVGAAPKPLRGVRAARRSRASELRPWLRPAAVDLAAERARRQARAEVLDGRRSIMQVLARRSVAELQRNRAFFARERDVHFVSPLLEPEVVATLADSAGRLGFESRAVALGTFCGDLLPASILNRTTKAAFNATNFNRHTRAFAERWTGEGVDHELVDAEVLRELWRGPANNALSAALLQAAWLAQEGHVR